MKQCYNRKLIENFKIMAKESVDILKGKIDVKKVLEQLNAALAEEWLAFYQYCLVNIAIGGRKDADAANYLQSCVESHMIDHSEQILNALAPLRKGHRFEFWEFYFSNIIAVETIEEELNRLVELHKDCHPEDVQMMKDAFKYFYNGANQSSVSYLEAD